MGDILIERLLDEIEKQGFNYKSLSLASGLGETTVRDIIMGRARNPRRDTLQKISETLGLPVTYFLIGGASVPVTDAGTYLPLEQAVREHEGKNSGSALVAAPPESGFRTLAALRLKGKAMLPYLPEGSIVYYDERRENNLDEWLEKLCVVQAHGGTTDVYVLRGGATYGRYDLVSYNAPAIADAEIEWCAKAVFIKPA